jgi:hypothetical protein
VYFSLKSRIEREHGPGSWEEWLKATPEVESGTFHSASTAPQKPRNLKARFWTGVPRIADRSVVRLDRHGYSVGYSKKSNRPLWLSAYLTGRPSESPTPTPSLSLKKWKDDPTLTKAPTPTSSPTNSDGHHAAHSKLPSWLSWLRGPADRSSDAKTPLPKGYSRGHFISPELMARSYGWADDSWFKSNQLPAPSGFCNGTWPSLLKLAETYSKIYGGLALYIVPIYRDGTPHPSHVGMVMVRPSAKGPVALSLMVATDGSQDNTAPEKLLTSPAVIEEESGVYLFADLPPEWRKYLLHDSQNVLWPTGS